MFEFLPNLDGKPFFLKISILILVIAVSLVLTSILGLLIALPFFGTGILENFNELNNAGNEFTIRFLKYFQVVNQLGVFIIPVLFYAYLEKRKIGNYLKVDKRPGLVYLVLSSILIISSIPAINWMVVLNEQMGLPEFMKGLEGWMRESEDKANKFTEAFLEVDTISGLIVNLFIIAMLAALGEELLFRGVVLQLFYEGLKNSHLAVFISAILFSALHLQFYGFLPRTVLGILFGYIFIWTGSLWIPIILHFLFNGITVVAAYLYNTGHISTDIESFGTTDNNIIIIGSFIISIILLFAIYRIRKIRFTQT
ncbi:MAG: CPBP family intramembrane metalloprotease [Bacteroidales bacterium]|nr:CPBP family intramembrane metalloprotease [Bacteroidales bacterium]